MRLTLTAALMLLCGVARAQGVPVPLAPGASAQTALPASEGLPPQRLAHIQAALQAAHLDGWLFYDFRRSDPIAYRVLGLDLAHAGSRRWYCLIPARGQPRKLATVWWDTH